MLNKEHFTSHLQYKHSGTFANRKYEELSYPKNQKMCDPILVTLLEMRPHYGQSSRANAIPFSGTSPLASYKEVHLRDFSHVLLSCLSHKKRQCSLDSLREPYFNQKLGKVFRRMSTTA